MAAEDEGRTEEASEYKIEKARKEGRVPKSQDLVTSLILLFGVLILVVFARYIFLELTEAFRFYFVRISEKDFSQKGFVLEFYNVLVRCVLPIMIVGAVIGIIANIVQNKGFIFSVKPITPNFSKIVPRFGEYLKKTIFSLKGFFNIVKSIGKVAVIVLIAYFFIRKDIFILVDIIENQNIVLAIGQIAKMAAQILITVAVFFLVIAIPDYFIQKYDFMNEMKMSKQEQKEEFKEMEGDPEVKGRLKQMQQQMLQQNMPKAVAESDVVIANPEHFAVALKFDEQVSDAPVVNAKGVDNMAQTIKEIAKENNVPIVTNRPVARELYNSVEVGDRIPKVYYNVVSVIYAQLDKYK